jgi:probable HAF family extracellular repeat protein
MRRLNHYKLKWIGVLAVLLFVSSLNIPVSFSQGYEVIVIEPPAECENSMAYGINNAGYVVGRFYNCTPEPALRAFIWDSINGATVLPTLSGNSSAWAVNEYGLVSGYSYNVDAYKRAVWWDSINTAITDIGALTNETTGISGNESSAYGINNLGLVIGLADIPNDAGDFTPFHAFLYDTVTGIQDLGTFTTLYPEWQNGYSIAYGINDNSEVVGIANDAGTSWFFLPFIYDATNGMQELMRDTNYLDGEWYGIVINDYGLIGGFVIVATNQSLPFYWENKSSAPIQVLMPAGFPYGEIYGINSFGDIVGIMWDSDQENATEHAFIFDTQNGIQDLNDFIDPTSGWVLTFARDINDNGSIVGTGNLNGDTH